MLRPSVRLSGFDQFSYTVESDHGGRHKGPGLAKLGEATANQGRHLPRS
jgi:hypothetical protein